jgi:hypothetical protein
MAAKFEPRGGHERAGSSQMDGLRAHLPVGRARFPYRGQVGGVEAQANRVAADRRHTGAADEPESLGDLGPCSGGFDCVGQALVGPSALPSEVGVVKPQAVGVGAHRAHRCSRSTSQSECT